MANAFAVTTGAPDIDETGLSFVVGIAYSGPDVNGGLGDVVSLRIRVLAGDTANVTNGKVSQAIRDEATARGYTVVTNGLIQPNFVKG